MTGIIVIFGLLLITVIVILGFTARSEARQGPPPMQTRTLREIENVLSDIQYLSTDIYAQGQAGEARQKIRKVLDGQ